MSETVIAPGGIFNILPGKEYLLYFKDMIKKIILTIILSFILSGCMFYPARTVMPLKTEVVDAESGQPIEGASFLRIVCDVHDFNCSSAKIDRGITGKDGFIEVDGERKWGLYIFAPGGVPVPNHNIAIWKPGYSAFVFSQYGNIETIKETTNREDVIKAISEIPNERTRYDKSSNPNELFINGQIKLYKINK